jgi:hypothetical protein
VPGERAEQLDVLLGAVDLFPVVLTDAGHLEQPARLDPGPVAFELTRPEPRLTGRQPFADLLVDLLDLAEERITAVGKHVRLLPDGQVPARPQRLPGPPVPDPRIDPLPGRSREHQADLLLRPPILEPPLHHLDIEPGQVAPCHCG